MSDEQKARVAGGPGLEDFLTESVHLDDAPTVPEHLKKKKGQHLRLPKWLKTDIPIGKNYTRLRDSLRKLNLNTVSLLTSVSCITFELSHGTFTLAYLGEFFTSIAFQEFYDL